MIAGISSEKIYVLGAGAIGGLVGGRLTQRFGKENIALIDADAEHVRATRDMGLRIYDKGRKNAFMEVIEVDITTPEEIDKSTLDNVVLATKSYSNDTALEGLRRDIALLVLQNGYDERLEEFGSAVRGVEFGFACKVPEPGQVFNAVKGKYVLGDAEGAGQATERWAKLLNEGGIAAEMRSNIDGYLWSKLLINSALNPVSAVKRFTFRELIETRESRELFKDLYMEGYPIVRRKAEELRQKLGSFLGPPNLVNWVFHNEGFSDFVLRNVADKFGEVESSMLQDVRRNRPTEIDYINGAIIRLGRGYGMETAKNEWICEEVKKLEPQRKMAHSV